MKKGKRIGTPLPEAMIQHIQSFMSGKEAAQTTLISKSWYDAWLTRPTIDLDDRDFDEHGRTSLDDFEKYAAKTMNRYLDSRLKIECFRLQRHGHYRVNVSAITHDLIVNAMKIGATDVELVLPTSFTLPREVLGSETLVRLSISWCGFDSKHVSCSSLKSLSLKFVRCRSTLNEFKDIISCCSLLEELSLSNCFELTVSRDNLYKLHKLRHLVLYKVYLDSMFFIDFESRFPCLKDLSVHECYGPSNIKIASTLLQTISFKPMRGSCKARFDVPNIRKFTYSASGLPQFSINGALQEWDFDISIACNSFHKLSWFLNLKKLLTKFRLSRIFLTIDLQLTFEWHRRLDEYEVDNEALPNRLVVENLMITAPLSVCSALLVRLFEIFRPKFITHYWPSYKCHGNFYGRNETLDILWKRLMQQSITPKCGIPDQSMREQFGLKKVNVEVYEMFGIGWQPLLLKKPLDPSKVLSSKRKITKGSSSTRKIRLELIWED